MLDITLRQIAAWTGGELLVPNPDMQIKGFSTDSRTIAEGELFIAVSGENFNGMILSKRRQKMAQQRFWWKKT